LDCPISAPSAGLRTLNSRRALVAPTSPTCGRAGSFRSRKWSARTGRGAALADAARPVRRPVEPAPPSARSPPTPPSSPRWWPAGTWRP